MYYLGLSKDLTVTVRGLSKALYKFKDFSRQAVKFKGFSILYELVLVNNY